MSVDNSDDDVVTIKEYCEEEKMRQDEAIAVLGAADENKCTYSLGYLERQALFSCSTCQPLNENRGGICYGCSVHCHQGHDLVELYTKRNFRCDCGNSKFEDFSCNLHEEKENANEKNQYNHNFIGKYCTCERPYPDPDDEIEDEMLQCVLCEDWYHSRHLGSLAPADYGELICDNCVKQHPFLCYYKDFAVPPVTVISQDEADKGDIDVTSHSTNSDSTHICTEKDNLKDDSLKNNATENEASQGCLLEFMKKKHTIGLDLVSIFFEEGWRNKLCQCNTCKVMYADKNIEYIIKESDTIASYEKKGKENVEKVLEEAASTISSLNKVHQVELLHGYHELKSGLDEFVRGFGEGQVIRKEDVDNFFENLNARKRRRLDGSGHYR